MGQDISATLNARASVNFPPFEWHPILGGDEFWRSYRSSLKMKLWDESRKIECLENTMRTTIIIADRVDNLKPIPVGSDFEVRADGSQTAKPRVNGIFIAYHFDTNELRQHGWPDFEQLMRAFEEDAPAILTEAYANQGPVERPWPSRQMRTVMADMPPELAAVRRRPEGQQVAVDTLSPESHPGVHTEKKTPKPPIRYEVEGMPRRAFLHPIVWLGIIVLGGAFLMKLALGQSRTENGKSR
jgi:hypothetical protein